MAKTRQEELKWQADILSSLKNQGFLSTKTSDRFKAGRPDVRMSRIDTGQMDVELKYCDLPIEYLWSAPGQALQFDTGLKLLQRIKIDEMNEHGMPAIGLVYVKSAEVYLVTNVLRDSLSDPSRYVKRGTHKGNVIDGAELMEVAKRYLQGAYKND